MSEERQLELRTAQIEELTENRVKAIRSKVPTGIGPAHCVECGDPIPDARRWGGYDHCVSCAEWKEEMNKRFGRVP